MQQPSSLIFLAIVVIWAAYLLQHWIRRREALATARSVDQFSDAMRVLERREHRVEGVAEQASDPAHASRTSAPRISDSGPRPSLRAGTVMTGETPQPPTQPSAENGDEASASATQKLAAASNSSAEAVQRFGNFAAHAGSPKLRAIALIGSLSLLVITVVCAPFGALPWWSPVLMLVVSGGVFWWCRASAMAAGAAQRRSGASAHQRPRASVRKGDGVQLPQQRRTAAPAAAAPAEVPLTKATMPEPVVESAPVADSDQVFDVIASDTTASQQPVAPPLVSIAPEPAAQESVAQESVAESVGQEAAEEWEPVAVPRPTYTMKERAPERPQQAPAATSSKRSYDDVANEDLPFDGLALDQDLDDLPSVFRAG
ncbi:MAG TPA: hypothetical protein VG502_11965 [Flexivirga sp.]|uniref:hypothetical protein n=1 Tax=Flexivirga sp. TaxID=1962927 RepID=UPI002CC8A7B8|nr:hypothetical protein [Flexivirga sp.]HWC23007.1 hypothetical protein [Flexivirga sp.]